MSEQIQSFDRAVLQAINQSWTHPWLDGLFTWGGSEKFFVPLLILLALALLVFGRARERAFVLIAILNLGIGDALVNQGIRSWVQRPRPHEAIPGTRQLGLDKHWGVRVRVTEAPAQRPKGRSLPSGHVLNNVSIAAAAIWLYPRLFPLLVPWMIFMAYCRIYVGAHYWSDVILSTWLALAYCAVHLVLFDALWRRLPWLRTRGPSPVFD